MATLTPFISRIINTTNGEFLVRPIMTSDSDMFFDIIASQKDTIQHRRQFDITQFKDAINDSNNQFLYLGAFQNGELKSCYGTFFWSKMPYTTNQGLIIKQQKFFNPSSSGLTSLMCAIYEYSELNGYYTHYSVRFAERFETELKMWDKYTKFSTYYDRSVEEFVPAFHKPKWESHWNIMEKQCYPYDTIIHCVRLKNQYRKRLKLYDEDIS